MSNSLFRFLEDCNGEFMWNIERMCKVINSKEEFDTMISCLDAYRNQIEEVEQMLILERIEKFGDSRCSQ